MPQQTKIFNLRQSLGFSRQPPHKSELVNLGVQLSTMGLEHPYALERDQIEALLTEASFREGGRGLLASENTTEFLYRICSIRKLVEYTGWKAGNKYENNEDLWSTLKQDLEVAGEWQSLERYASGVLEGPRGFTWWTSLNLLPSNIVCAAHAIGLPNDLLPKYAVILRCPVAFVNGTSSFRVPSVLDAFDGEIFHPTINQNSPQSGLTISLENSSAVLPGTDEFVLTDVAVAQISVWPVLIDRLLRASHSVQLDLHLRTLLENYYEELV